MRSMRRGVGEDGAAYPERGVGSAAGRLRQSRLVGEDPSPIWAPLASVRAPSASRIQSSTAVPSGWSARLRRHEDLTGQSYGLPGVDLIPSLAVVSSAERTSHLGEATEQLDVTVSVCTVSAVATLLVAAATVTDGWWLLMTLLPFALCLVGYRGAVSVAHSYGLAMRRLVDLERFTLYAALHLPLPRAASEEAMVAEVISSHLKGVPADVRFAHPQDSTKA